MAFESVIGRGSAATVEDMAGRRRSLALIMAQYGEGEWTFPDAVLERTAVIAVEIAEISGKSTG